MGKAAPNRTAITNGQVGNMPQRLRNNWPACRRKGRLDHRVMPHTGAADQAALAILGQGFKLQQAPNVNDDTWLHHSKIHHRNQALAASDNLGRSHMGRQHLPGLRQRLGNEIAK